MITEPIRDRKQLKALAGYWLNRKNYRNYALIFSDIFHSLVNSCTQNHYLNKPYKSVNFYLYSIPAAHLDRISAMGLKKQRHGQLSILP